MVASFDTLDAFHKISGLKVNNEKTEVLWIGASSGNQQEFLPERNLKWAKESVKALGVWLSTIISKVLSLNYNDKIEKNPEYNRKLGDAALHAPWENYSHKNLSRIPAGVHLDAISNTQQRP